MPVNMIAPLHVRHACMHQEIGIKRFKNVVARFELITCVWDVADTNAT